MSNFFFKCRAIHETLLHEVFGKGKISPIVILETLNPGLKAALLNFDKHKTKLMDTHS